MITPNLSEFEAVAGACNQSDEKISNAAKAMCTDYDFDAVLVTRSERGMTLQPRRVILYIYPHSPKRCLT